jgi:hypothetical protein|tara:strand:+ start:3234 stop:3473 length:240 start_codon:yes stop_codon:yes gene_type:complete
MKDLTGNKINKYNLLLPLILFIGLCYGCEDEPEQQVVDPNNLFQFVLQDVNPNSKSYKNDIGPALYKGRISVYYFGDPG